MANPAETYEREMVPALFGPWTPLLLEYASLRFGDRVLDLACGTGIVARHAARRLGVDGHVVGLDMSPGMLAVARDMAEREGLSIDWREGDLEALPFADGEFDVVTCQHGLQFVSDRVKALKEARRVLHEGGRIAIAAWQGLDRHPFWATFNEALIRRIGIPALAAPFSLGSADELERLLVEAGFSDVSVDAFSMPAHFTNPDGFVAMEVDVIAAAIPATQHLDDRARAELRAELAADMAAPIREVLRDDVINIQMHAHLARGIC